MRAMEGCLRRDGEGAVAVGVSCLLPDKKEIAEGKRSLLSSWALYLSRCDRRLRLLETPKFFGLIHTHPSMHVQSGPLVLGHLAPSNGVYYTPHFIYLFILRGYYKPHEKVGGGGGGGKVRLIQTLYLGSMFLL